MKKISTLFAILFIAVTASAQVLNGGFENWTAGNPDNWATSNIFPVNIIPVTQSSDAHSGSSAVRGEVVPYMIAAMGPVIQSGTDATGFPVSQQYYSVQLWYKFIPQGSDRFGVNIALEKNGSPIAQGAVAIENAATEWTFLTVPFAYTTVDVPDKADIQIMIVGPNGADYHIGSVMMVDDIQLSLENGIGSAFEAKTCAYPVPATDFINISVPENNSVVRIFDFSGKEIMKSASDGKICRFDISSLTSGIYLYSVNELSKGRFIVR